MDLLLSICPMADQVLSIDQIEFDPRNARRRTERSSYMIRESLQKFGPLRSLVGQRLPDGRIIVRAGNGTLEEAGQIGIDKVRVVERKSDELVVVVADDLDESRWKSYAIADNRASDLSDWDEEVLIELNEEIDLSDWFLEDEIYNWGQDEESDRLEPFEEEEDDEDGGTSPAHDRYIVPIALSWSENQQWEEAKGRLNLSNDKKAFLAIIDKFLAMPRL